MKADIIEYLEDLDWPIEENKGYQMSLSTLRQHIRNYFDSANREAHSEAKSKAREECVNDFIKFLTTNGICHSVLDTIYGIGKIDDIDMIKRYGYSKNPNPNGGTYFAGRSNRSLSNSFNPED